MSLIEDAARRLEELRRAGAELPDDRPDGSSAKPVDTPLPEAVVAAMESKRLESGLLSAHAQHAERHVADRSPRAPGAERAAARAPVRHVDLNLE